MYDIENPKSLMGALKRHKECILYREDAIELTTEYVAVEEMYRDVKKFGHKSEKIVDEFLKAGNKLLRELKKGE